MRPVPIVAASGFTRNAHDVQDDLREVLRAVCPAAPRRVNRLTELSLIGAHGCVGTRRPVSDTAVYMAFTSGCIADSVRLLRHIVGGRPPMPMDFINVSSNMTGFHVAASLDLHSSNQVVASTDFGWESALELALLGGERAFLLGAVEECAWPLHEHRERLGLDPDVALLETSQWLWVDRAATAPIAMLEWLGRFADDHALATFLAAQSWPAPPGLCVVGADAAELAQQTGLEVAPDSFHAGYSGLAGAAACVRFMAAGQGALLYLTRGRGGHWAAAHITRTPPPS